MDAEKFVKEFLRMNRIFNKNFWHFLMGFLAMVAVSLFLIIAVGTFTDLEAKEGEEAEECILFC